MENEYIDFKKLNLINKKKLVLIYFKIILWIILISLIIYIILPENISFFKDTLLFGAIISLPLFLIFILNEILTQLRLVFLHIENLICPLCKMHISNKKFCKECNSPIALTGVQELIAQRGTLYDIVKSKDILFPLLISVIIMGSLVYYYIAKLSNSP
ncbi:MAG: hypothetical protein INQ03_09075 [Candidatus Heimdallarchaeota archaeon]|nr:hypothetical protein [Candidatus Heimdallarchaeota archaeon]